MKTYTREEIKRAYKKACKEGPSDETRNICLLNPYYSYYYAHDIDGIARKDTKRGVVVDPYYLYNYICDVEEKIFYIDYENLDYFNDLLYAKRNKLGNWGSDSGFYLGIYPINLFRNEII